jgi:hypothetical protein
MAFFFKLINPGYLARSVLETDAINKCRGLMEYWNFGLRLVELRACGSERIIGLERPDLF